MRVTSNFGEILTKKIACDLLTAGVSFEISLWVSNVLTVCRVSNEKLFFLQFHDDFFFFLIITHIGGLTRMVSDMVAQIDIWTRGCLSSRVFFITRRWRTPPPSSHHYLYIWFLLGVLGFKVPCHSCNFFLVHKLHWESSVYCVKKKKLNTL